MLPPERIMRHPIIRRPRVEGNAFAKIIDAIEAARGSGLKRIAMRFEKIIIKPGKQDRQVYVFSATETEINRWDQESPKYLGWLKDGQANIGDSAILDEINLIAKDPLSAAQMFGQKTGNCSCCGRTLTVEESIRLGIGPICRAKFGL